MFKDDLGNARFAGVYRAVVVDNNDPLGKNRLKLKIPQLIGDLVTGWCWGIFPNTAIVLPDIDEGVWVVFEGGDPSYPTWLGSFNPGPTPLNYGSFFDTTDQIAASINTGYHIQVNSTDTSCTKGISVINDENGKPTKIQVNKTGVYNFAFSFQLHNTGGGGSGSTVQIWFAKNETNIPDSNTRIDVPSNAPYVVAAWNLFIKLNAGEYGQIMWSTDNAAIMLEHNSSSSPGPAIPSVIITVNQVS